MEKSLVWLSKKKETSTIFNFRYGFVEFADIRNAEESLVENEKDFMGRLIRVELANKDRKRPARDEYSC
jgi:hypothetical protein